VIDTVAGKGTKEMSFSEDDAIQDFHVAVRAGDAATAVNRLLRVMSESPGRFLCLVVRGCIIILITITALFDGIDRMKLYVAIHLQ